MVVLEPTPANIHFIVHTSATNEVLDFIGRVEKSPLTAAVRPRLLGRQTKPVCTVAANGRNSTTSKASTNRRASGRDPVFTVRMGLPSLPRRNSRTSNELAGI